LDSLNQFGLATSKTKKQLQIETTDLKTTNNHRIGRNHPLIASSSKNCTKMFAGILELNSSKANHLEKNHVSDKITDTYLSKMKNLKSKLEENKFRFSKENLKGNLFSSDIQQLKKNGNHNKRISDLPKSTREMNGHQTSKEFTKNKEIASNKILSNNTSIRKINKKIVQRLGEDTLRRCQTKQFLTKFELKSFESKSKKENISKTGKIISSHIDTSNF